MVRFTIFLCCGILLASCSLQSKSNGQTIKRLRFIGQFVLPHKMQFKGTTVGGLSSIDYSAKDSLYYLICDDRSDINPARFYKAKIQLTERGIRKVEMVDVITLKQKNGTPYPNRKQNSLLTPDPEGLRIFPSKNTLFWVSEGERLLINNTKVLVNPSVNIMTTDGRLIDTLPIPSNMLVMATEKGPRRNGIFEGLSFDPEFNHLFVSIEEPLYEDGPRAGINDSAGWVRIIKYLNNQTPAIQYAYRIDPVVRPPSTLGGFVINGVSDILAVGKDQLLVTERSFSAGHSNNHSNVRVYLASLKNAEDVADRSSLQNGPGFRPIVKKLLLNMDDLGIFVDNIEGATLGPKLANGKRSLIFVSDDNFSEAEKTQFLLFEIN